MMHGRHHGESGMNWMHAFGSGYGMIWMILFWVVLIGIVAYVITKVINNSKKKTPGQLGQQKLNNSPLQILQERLAKGEIDEAEYERLRAIIKRDE